MIEVVFDLEGWPIERGRLAPPIVCVSWVAFESQPLLALWDGACRSLVADWLRDPAADLVGANIAYDLACIEASDRETFAPLIRDAYAAGRVRDVLLDGKLLDIAAGRYEHVSTAGGGWSLASLARRVGLELDKDEHAWRLRYKALDGVPVEHWPQGARDYALGDAAATAAVRAAQKAAATEWLATTGIDPLDGGPAPGHSARAAAKAYALHKTSCWGVLTDRARVAGLRARAGDFRALCSRRLQRAGLVRADGSRDTKAAAALMAKACAKVGRPVPTTPTGRTQLDRDACILSGSRVLELYAEYTGSGTLWSRVENMANGFELPLQTRFDPLKETARTSSSQPDGALVGEQMQNFPRASGVTPAERKAERDGAFYVGLRECFTPRPGNIFVGADYSMAELHTVAQLCISLFGFSKLAELLNAGIDVHWWLAAVTLGMSYEQIRANEKPYKKDRQRVKPGNFGFWGGMGDEKFVLYSRKGYGIRYTPQEAHVFKGQWKNALPETGPYFDWISRQLGARRGARFVHVHPITGFVRGGCTYTSGANHGFQHLCAYGAGDALAAVERACCTPGSPLWGWRMWNFVHDEILLEGPLDGAHDAALELQRIMEVEFNKWVPNVPTHAEPFVTPIWSKQATAVKDAAGRLIAWEPKK